MKISELGKFLREYRRRSGLDVKQVHEIFEEEYQMSVSEKTIYNWESQQYNISAPKLLALCEIYGIKDLTMSADDLDKASQGTHISVKEQKLIMAYREHKELQHAIDKMLDL